MKQTVALALCQNEDPDSAWMAASTFQTDEGVLNHSSMEGWGKPLQSIRKFGGKIWSLDSAGATQGGAGATQGVEQPRIG